MPKSTRREYTVGYRKPPQATRFKAGQSGNPSGRPKGSISVSQIVLRTAQERVTVTEHGVQKKVRKIDLATKIAFNKAIQGNLRALAIIYASLPESDLAGVTPNFAAEDHAIVANLLRNFRTFPSKKSPAKKPTRKTSRKKP